MHEEAAAESACCRSIDAVRSHDRCAPCAVISRVLVAAVGVSLSCLHPRIAHHSGGVTRTGNLAEHAAAERRRQRQQHSGAKCTEQHTHSEGKDRGEGKTRTALCDLTARSSAPACFYPTHPFPAHPFQPSHCCDLCCIQPFWACAVRSCTAWCCVDGFLCGAFSGAQARWKTLRTPRVRSRTLRKDVHPRCAQLAPPLPGLPAVGVECTVATRPRSAPRTSGGGDGTDRRHSPHAEAASPFPPPPRSPPRSLSPGALDSTTEARTTHRTQRGMGDESAASEYGDSAQPGRHRTRVQTRSVPPC